MSNMGRMVAAAALAALGLALGPTAEVGEPAGVEPELCQAVAVLTVAESKRLIAKGVAELPAVRKALREGTVIVTTGTTNSYVAEELLGRKIEPGAFVTGVTLPAKGGKAPPAKRSIAVVVLKEGKEVEGATLEAALKDLKAGDVVVKGANCLDYENRCAGVFIGHQAAGTTGQIMPYVVGRKAHLVIPIGLEKLTPGLARAVEEKMRQPVKSLNRVPSMYLLTGEIVTELEALKLLCGVEAFQAGAGGVGGAEGGRWLVFRGPKENVEKALKLVEGLQGEPPFVK